MLVAHLGQLRHQWESVLKGYGLAEEAPLSTWVLLSAYSEHFRENLLVWEVVSGMMIRLVGSVEVEDVEGLEEVQDCLQGLLDQVEEVRGFRRVGEELLGGGELFEMMDLLVEACIFSLNGMVMEEDEGIGRDMSEEGVL